VLNFEASGSPAGIGCISHEVWVQWQGHQFHGPMHEAQINEAGGQISVRFVSFAFLVDNGTKIVRR